MTKEPGSISIRDGLGVDLSLCHSSFHTALTGFVRVLCCFSPPVFGVITAPLRVHVPTLTFPQLPSPREYCSPIISMLKTHSDENGFLGLFDMFLWDFSDILKEIKLIICISDYFLFKLRAGEKMQIIFVM